MKWNSCKSSHLLCKLHEINMFSWAFVLTPASSSCDSTVTETNGNSDSYMTDAQPETGDEMKVRGE